jgi:predicted alpha/beta hydrolase family esterase
MPRIRLPFASIVAASSDDPWCAAARTILGRRMGAKFHDIGERGHINSESGLDGWPQGRVWLTALTALTELTEHRQLPER